jgi:hypothetical protein
MQAITSGEGGAPATRAWRRRTTTKGYPAAAARLDSHAEHGSARTAAATGRASCSRAMRTHLHDQVPILSHRAAQQRQEGKADVREVAEPAPHSAA